MRAWFVLVLVTGAFLCMAATPVPFRIAMALAGVLLGVLAERKLFQLRDPDTTKGVYGLFLAVLATALLVLPWAAYSPKLGGMLVLVACAGLGAELSISRRDRAGRKLACDACGKKVGGWPAEDLESFKSWKCPACGELAELHGHRTEPAPGAAYRTATEVEHRDRVFRPDLPTTMGITVPKWVTVILLAMMAYPIIGALVR